MLCCSDGVMYGFNWVNPGTILATVSHPSRALTWVTEAIGTLVVVVGEDAMVPQPAKASTRKAIKDFFSI